MYNYKDNIKKLRFYLKKKKLIINYNKFLMDLITDTSNYTRMYSVLGRRCAEIFPIL